MYAAVISVVVVLGFFGVMGLWFLGYTPKDSQALTMLIGALIAAFTTVVQYWMGSSVGSKIKDVTLATLSSENTGGK